MSATDDNFKEIYSRINSLEREQSRTNGYLKAIIDSNQMQTEQNDKYMKLVWRVILILSGITLLAVFALIYGAIGERGLKSVRESVPALPISTSIDSPAIPWQDDKIDGHEHNGQG